MEQKGFTLLEVLVAAVIIIVLTAVGVTSYASVSKKSRDSKRTSDLEQLRSALEMYRSDNGSYPAVNVGSFGSISSLQNTIVGSTGIYMKALPTDPRGYTYYYRTESNPAYQYCLASYNESGVTGNTCKTALGATIALPNISGVGQYNYGLSNP